MLIDGTYALSDEPNAFPARLRKVLDSYGTAVALAQAIGRSEGAIRKWLRGKSEPDVSDLRAICEATNTNVEWLVFGQGDPKRMDIREPSPPRYCRNELRVRTIAACAATLLADSFVHHSNAANSQKNGVRRCERARFARAIDDRDVV